MAGRKFIFSVECEECGEVIFRAEKLLLDSIEMELGRWDTHELEFTKEHNETYHPLEMKKDDTGLLKVSVCCKADTFQGRCTSCKQECQEEEIPF